MYMGEREPWLSIVLELGANLLWNNWLGGGPGTCLLREKYLESSWFWLLLGSLVGVVDQFPGLG